MLGSVQLLHFVFFLRSGLSRRDAPEAVDDSQIHETNIETKYFVLYCRNHSVSWDVKLC